MMRPTNRIVGGRLKTSCMKLITAIIAAWSLVWLFEPGLVFSQSSEEEIREENFLEAVLTSADDVPEIFETMDLNKASSDDLLTVAWVDEKFASSIVEYRRRVRFIHRIDELSRLDGATSDALAALRRRVRIVEGDNFRVEARSYSSISPQALPLYQEACGENGTRNFQRLDLTFRNYEICLVTDKDPGERNFLDFYSLAAAVKGVSIFSAINVGNYRLSMGNGLLFSSGGVVSKAAEAVTPLFNRSPYSLKPYKSRAETRYLRGAAFEIPLGHWMLTGFASAKEFSVHLDSLQRVTSIDYSGLNLPPSSTTSGKKLYETIAGGLLHYDGTWGSWGVSGAYLSYDRRFSNYYKHKQLAVNTFLRAHSERLAFSGEVMIDKFFSFTSNLGIDYDQARFAVGLRSLRSGIVSNYGGVLSESFPTSPEQGIYFGASLRAADIAKVGCYYDRFRIVSITGDPDRNGEEIFADCYLSLSRYKLFDGSGTLVYLRYRYKTKEDYYLPESDFPVAQSTLAGSKQSFRVELRHRFSGAFSLRTRFEKNFLSTGEKGEMFVFDCSLRANRLSLSPRACFYSTNSYNSAFYVVEGDLPGIALFSILYGEGARVSLSTSLRINGCLSMGGKVSRDIFHEDREIAVKSSSRIVPGLTTFSVELNYVVD